MIAFLVVVSGSLVAVGQVDFEAGRFVLRAVVALVQSRSLSGLVSISLETFNPEATYLVSWPSQLLPPRSSCRTLYLRGHPSWF